MIFNILGNVSFAALNNTAGQFHNYIYVYYTKTILTKSDKVFAFAVKRL